MIKISLDLNSNGIGHQIFDCWYALRQSKEENYSFSLISTKRDQADLNLLFDYMPTRLIDSRPYDMIFICNGGEPYSVASPLIKDMLEDPKIFFITNAYHEPGLHLGHKNIWYPHNILTCQQYWTSGFYPQHHDNHSKFSVIERQPSIAAINGQNRTWRHHFFKKMLEKKLDIFLHVNFDVDPVVTTDSQWESDEDRHFRDYVNDLYIDSIQQKTQSEYYNNSIPVGLNQKFGKIPPGYFLLPGYFQNSCMVFPETDWQNDFLVITEKSLKCFYSGCLPFPIAGANVNSLYNKLGFFTAWNLLPDYLREFDSIRDHDLRYERSLEALAWLANHPDVWSSDDFKEFTKNNKLRFLSCEHTHLSVTMFDQLISEKLKI